MHLEHLVDVDRVQSKYKHTNKHTTKDEDTRFKTSVARHKDLLKSMLLWSHRDQGSFPIPVTSKVNHQKISLRVTLRSSGINKLFRPIHKRMVALMGIDSRLGAKLQE